MAQQRRLWLAVLLVATLALCQPPIVARAQVSLETDGVVGCVTR